MNSHHTKYSRTLFTPLASVAAAALLLTACGADSDPLEDDDTQADGDTIVIGSQAYYSNEIIAEIYAQVLEDEGFEVERDFQIGQREVYMPELESGEIDLVPDYTGNLVQYYSDEADSGSPEEVHEQVSEVLPDGLQALDFADATDQDSYTVTSQTAEEYDLTSIGDLTELGDSVTMAANSEFETRPYGPEGAQELYGVTIELTAVEDSGGPLTVGALTDGDVQVADIYTSSPAIEAEDLVVLEDPEYLILPQNVVPIASAELDDQAVDALNEVQAQLGAEDLVELNTRSVEDEAPAADVASQWLEQQG
ncbi:ABC transporter substrate-binding protein [Yaniella halotolerans]|uniref:ABC transporter substrate-binding protein n=1 Tax=Yaniella halotolerans TaxID=225453 RepID=UPI000416F11D|nr:ABC transporter substrate-binding protein [Yaniella halotolerans]